MAELVSVYRTDPISANLGRAGDSTGTAAGRLAAVDALRGAVMVLMALDHTRDFIHAGAMAFSPEDLARTTPILFLTRWITHICAPTFMFLAGAGAFLRLERERSVTAVSRFLWTRGLWLVLLEVTVMRLAMNFSLGPPYPVLLIVLTALGVAMIALAALIHLPRGVVLFVSLAVIALHNLLDPIQAARFGRFAGLWTLLHQQGVFTVGGITFVVAYPVLAWIGVMGAGYGCGPVLLLDAQRRRRLLLFAGGAMLIGFLLLRTANGYGDPSPWSAQSSTVFTVLSFLRTTKYPPSLQFLLMTLGPALIALAWLERHTRNAAVDALATIGRVPMFFYVVHFTALHVVASSMAWVRYGRQSLAFLFNPLPSMGGPAALFPPGFGYPLWTVYVVWLGIVLSLYPVCRWFAGVKKRRRDWWVSYL
jgi:uncharacterized membrane protein